MKILYVTTIGSTMGFFITLIKNLINSGNIVDIATNEEAASVPDCYKDWGCRIMQLDISRSPADSCNIKSISSLRKIVSDGNYDIVHCHTPVASVCARLACRKLRKKGLKVIYTAHGFHFYKGAPLKNWMIYYPAEKICAHWTDVLITINNEDYALAEKKMKAKQVKYVPGVGIDIKKFNSDRLSPEEKMLKRYSLGISDQEKVFLSVGELSKRKNHKAAILALSKLNYKKYRYFIVGRGELEQYLTDLIKQLGLEDNIKLLGYRSDVAELCSISDLFIFPSFQEGLPVALMEAIASRTPVICSDIRGSNELVDRKVMFDPENSEEIKAKIEDFIEGKYEDEAESNYGRLKQFELTNVIKIMKNIYGEFNDTEF